MIICPNCRIELDKNKDYYQCKKCNFLAKKKEDIIFFNPEISKDHLDYNSDVLDKLFFFEKKHFWFKIRKQIIEKIFKKFVKRNESILEVGSGTGYIAQSLIKNGYLNYSVSDIHKNGLLYSKNYPIKNWYQFDLLKSPFINEFDVIGMYDVLEHIENDKSALQSVCQMLKSNGKILLTLPAHNWLWSRVDEISSHKRRYSLKMIKELLKINGFKILTAKHFFVSIIPFLFLRILLNKNTKGNFEKDSGLKINFFFNKILFILSYLENIILAPFSPKIGGSIIIVGIKEKC